MFKVPNCAGSIGDCLSMTPLFKKQKGVVVMLKNDKTVNVLSRIYDHIAEVEFVDIPQPPCPETNDSACYSQRILKYFNIKDVSPIPQIVVSKDEYDWAMEFLKDYKNPVAFNSTVAEPKGHELATYRQLPINLCNSIIEGLSKTNTVLQFGLSKNHRPEIKNTINLYDLSIRQLAACYAVIQRYIGSDTGDYHLMLAVGGYCDVIIPPSAWNYEHSRHLYLKDAWTLEPACRVQYTVFQTK